jgi:hypothetical protein
VSEVDAQHGKEARPAILETLELIVPVIGGREEGMNHAHDAAIARATGDRDLGRDRRRACLPLALHIAELMRWLPHRDFSGCDRSLSEVEAEHTTNLGFDLAFGKPGGIARAGRHGLPDLLRRAREQKLHLDPTLACSVLLDRHDDALPSGSVFARCWIRSHEQPVRACAGGAFVVISRAE